MVPLKKLSFSDGKLKLTPAMSVKLCLLFGQWLVVAVSIRLVAVTSQQLRFFQPKLVRQISSTCIQVEWCYYKHRVEPTPFGTGSRPLKMSILGNAAILTPIWTSILPAIWTAIVSTFHHHAPRYWNDHH